MVELVVVIVIVGVLGSIAMPRFFDNQTFAERGFYEELAAALKFAQKAAVATGCPVRIVIDASGYQANQQLPLGGRCDPSDLSWGTAVMLADGQPLARPTPAGVTVSPSVTFFYDALGQTDLGANQSVAVGPHVLTVQAASGYVDAP